MHTALGRLRLLRTLVVLASMIMIVTVSLMGVQAQRAHSADTLHHWVQMGTNFRSDLHDQSANCYDSDRRVPVYLVDFNIKGGSGNAISHRAGGRCVSKIQIERSAWNTMGSKNQKYIGAHELDHLRGWNHTEGSTPNHNCTRTSGENAANPASVPGPRTWGSCIY